ncbi:MAG: alanine racemase [Burkholderiaceae bacterium]|jgi:D-serine dehydratase
MTDVLDPLLSPEFKGFPHGAAPLRRSAVGAQGWNVLAGDLPLPLALIRRDALAHNVSWMQRYANDAQVRFAPHGKTTMSPQLFRRQLDAGAWGLSFATVTQMRAGLAAGARNLLIANQVLDAADLGAIAAARETHPGVRVIFLLDSPGQLALIETLSSDRPFEVLLEVGVAGGRTGLRTHDAAVALARAAHASDAVSLVGLECYEGLGNTGRSEDDRPAAADLMDRVERLAIQCNVEGLFEADEVIVSAGGSGVFDLVVPRMRLALSRPVAGLLRSGCYVTHDQGHYQRLVHTVNQRLGCSDEHGLRAALEVWALVQSLPEPGLAILAVGKRDISYDLGMPVPLATCARASRDCVPAPEGWAIHKLNDQHAYLHLTSDTRGLRVGDRVCLGISHPCTTFDKWRWMPIVDEGYTVVDAIVTCF